MYQVVLSLLLLLPLINGDCTSSEVKTRQTASGRNITICTLSNGLEILNGSTVKLSSCQICTCNETHLTCCGMGAMAKEMPTPPNECKLIKDGCNYVMVRKSDETKDCKTGLSIVNQSPSSSDTQNFNLEQWRKAMMTPEFWNMFNGNQWSSQMFNDASKTLQNSATQFLGNNGASVPVGGQYTFRMESNSPVLDANSLVSNGFSSTSGIKSPIFHSFPNNVFPGANTLSTNSFVSSSSSGAPAMLDDNGRPVPIDVNNIAMQRFLNLLKTNSPNSNVRFVNTTKMFSSSGAPNTITVNVPSTDTSLLSRQRTTFTNQMPQTSKFSFSSQGHPMLSLPGMIPEFDSNNVASYQFSSNSAVGSPMLVETRQPVFDANSMAVKRIFENSGMSSPFTTYPISDVNRLNTVVRMETTNPILDANTLTKNVQFLNSASGTPFNPIFDANTLTKNVQFQTSASGTPFNPTFDANTLTKNVQFLSSASGTPFNPILDANTLTKNAQFLTSSSGTPFMFPSASNMVSKVTNGFSSHFLDGTPVLQPASRSSAFGGHDTNTNAILRPAVEHPVGMIVEESKPEVTSNVVIRNVPSLDVGIPIVNAAANTPVVSGSQGRLGALSVGTPMMRPVPDVVAGNYIDRRFTHPEASDFHLRKTMWS